MRNVADTGLQILYQLFRNMEKHEEASQSFYQTYFTDILQHIFSVVTDTSHTAGKLNFILAFKYFYIQFPNFI
jgi:exportin-1